MSSETKIDKDYNLDDQQEADFVQNRALQKQQKIQTDALPTRLYLENKVMEPLYKALQALAKERPLNPVEFFSYYLITHNKQKEQINNNQEEKQQVEDNNQEKQEEEVKS